jgi:N-acetylneuraminate synthase
MSVRFVAEVSSNHHRDLDRCYRFIDTAAQIGCDAVKFQLFRVSSLFAPEILARSAKHRARAAWELPPEFIAPLAGRCREAGIQFSCTPFYLEAVEQLAPYVDFFKVASYELLWHPLLMACAETGKPVVLSTGMATLEEVRASVAACARATTAPVQLLHCVSGYPTPIAECNLSAIATLREATGCSVGWSDHSVSPGVIHRAVHRWGAHMVEFHLDLDGEGEEFKTGHCWMPQQIGAVIAAVRDGLHADGDGIKAPAPSEAGDRQWRADPEDGLRPMKTLRSSWRG